MIAENSRYANAAIERATDAKGVTRPTLYQQPIAGGTTRYRFHRASQGERLDLLAHSLWGDPNLWWVIANYNPEVTTPDDVPAGMLIRIPVGL